MFPCTISMPAIWTKCPFNLHSTNLCVTYFTSICVSSIFKLAVIIQMSWNVSYRIIRNYPPTRRFYGQFFPSDIFIGYINLTLLLSSSTLCTNGNSNITTTYIVYSPFLHPISFLSFETFFLYLSLFLIRKIWMNWTELRNSIKLI